MTQILTYQGGQSNIQNETGGRVKSSGPRCRRGKKKVRSRLLRFSTRFVRSQDLHGRSGFPPA